MSEFKRENRYIVLKISRLHVEELLSLKDFIDSYQLTTEDCAVVEHDWPIYDETWENIQRLAEGRPSVREELQAQLEAATNESAHLLTISELQAQLSDTYGDQYRSELYVEMSERATAMGYRNVIHALNELELLKQQLAAIQKAIAPCRELRR